RAYERWVHTETARIKKVRKLQSAAGTSAEREAASSAAQKAEATLTTRSAEIAEIISKLETERAELQSAADAARDENEKRQTAVAKLREKSILPAYVADRLQQCKRRWADGDGHRIEVVRQRLAVLESLGRLDVSERRSTPGGPVGGEGLEVVQSFIEGLIEFGPDSNARLRAFGMLHESERPPYGMIVEVTPDGLNRAKWSAYLAGPVAAEIQTLRAEIARLEKLEVAHNSASAKLTDFYVPT
ncbi:MAG: hypothetical protein GX594_06590, partial [Pirellulaceae bacterium]|nr:hypothetical protein [Pirellulaceae bacterium]